MEVCKKYCLNIERGQTMKIIVFLFTLCFCLIISSVVFADVCPHEYPSTPTGYYSDGTGHQAYYECIYCDYVYVEPATGHSALYTTSTLGGSSGHCHTEYDKCSTCDYITSVTFDTSHYMQWTYDDFGDPQKHDKYYECQSYIQLSPGTYIYGCGYTSIGAILENHIWDANYICTKCGHVLE